MLFTRGAKRQLTIAAVVKSHNKRAKTQPLSHSRSLAASQSQTSGSLAVVLPSNDKESNEAVAMVDNNDELEVESNGWNSDESVEESDGRNNDEPGEESDGRTMMNLEKVIVGTVMKII